MFSKLFLFAISLLIGSFTAAQSENMALVLGGEYIPLFGNDSTIVAVHTFEMDSYPVTNKEFETFLKTHPEWLKKNTIALFAEANYLKQFDANGILKFGNNPLGPVTNVSWFAAKAYCACQNKRLPTTDEWEYVARADTSSPDARDKVGYNQYILTWYETPQNLNKSVGSTFENYWGIHDMFGLVWEWTSDFNSVLITGGSRTDNKKSNSRFCGGASIGATDLRNYAGFMRYAFRGSLKGKYALNNLGFRCAKTIQVN